MSANKAKSPAVLCKIVTVILGFIIVILGCISHFTSNWVKVTSLNFGVAIFSMEPYKICTTEGLEVEKCPHISLERYFVAIIIICFILSVCLLAATFFIEMTSPPLKYVDMGYHIVGAILLLVGAIVYFVSTEQIHDLFGINKLGDVINFRRPEKLAAASLTIIQSLLYGVTAFFIAKN